MAPGIRKFALTAHVTASVGWLGAVAAFLALSIVGLTSEDARLVRAAYLSMESITWLVIVPSSFASLLTGLVQALGTSWGLFGHYWILAKLLLNVVATALLLLHTEPISRVAVTAADRLLSSTDLRALRIRLVADAVAAVLALLAATALSVYKPGGLTPWGRRPPAPPSDQPQAGSPSSRPWPRFVILGLITLALLIVGLHLVGRGLHH